MRPQTVLHVVDRLTGGVPIAVGDYIANSPQEFRHTILAPFSEGKPSTAWNGVDAQMRDLGNHRASQAIRIQTIARRLKPSVIHAHSSFPGMLARLVPTGIPVAYSPHCFKFDDPSASPWLRSAVRLVERSLAGRTAVYGVLSEHESELARSLHPRATIIRIPNVASLANRTDFATDKTPATVGMMGRLATQKDPRFFARLAQRVHADHPEVEFRWLGGGSSDWDQELGSAHVRVSGWLEKQAVASALDELGLYVHTASYEGFPLSVLDAAARGVPVIAREIPALRELGLATFQNVDEGARLVERAIGDPEYRAKLIDLGDRMLKIMNPGTQRAALRRVWSMR